jgi:hypothetical protein
VRLKANLRVETWVVLPRVSYPPLYRGGTYPYRRNGEIRVDRARHPPVSSAREPFVLAIAVRRDHQHHHLYTYKHTRICLIRNTFCWLLFLRIMAKFSLAILAALVATASAFVASPTTSSASTALRATQEGVWDPLGLMTLGTGKAFDTFPNMFPDEQYLRDSEIKHGRQAMLAWTGVWATTDVRTVDVVVCVCVGVYRHDVVRGCTCSCMFLSQGCAGMRCN